MDLLFPYNESKLKPYLKMATQRINIANNKRATASTKHKREIAKLLEEGKAEKAIIRVEHVIRDDYTMEAYEIIELMCDLLYERARHLTKAELCPPDLVEAVSTVIWAASRVDIAELDGAKKQLQKKYGKEFVALCEENSRNTVNSRVMHKLNVVPPSNLLIRSYLEEIAKEYNVEWNNESFPIQEDGNYKDGHQIGYSVPMAPSSGLGGVYGGSLEQGGQYVPTPMSSEPPGYNDAQFHPTTEVGYHSQGPDVGQGQMEASQQKYQEEDMQEPPPQYSDVLQKQQQQHQQQQQQNGASIFFPPSPPIPQQQQPPPPSPPPSQDNAPPPNTSSSTPSYDDLMARFKDLKK